MDYSCGGHLKQKYIMGWYANIVCKNFWKKKYTNGHVGIDNFGLCINSWTSTCASLLQVRYCSGKHKFLTEPPRRKVPKAKESATNKQEKEKGAIQKVLTAYMITTSIILPFCLCMLWVRHNEP